MRIPAPNFTPTPNDLFDDWLPILKHVELKVLMAIMRKTFGWHKTRDKISLSQLEKITGSSRSKIIKATKNLQKLGLITKEVSGKKGEENTVYELVVIDDSNNSYQCPLDTGGGAQRAPTKEKVTNIKEKIKKEKTHSVRIAAPKITINIEKRAFEGTTVDDLKAWRQKFPAVNVDKELAQCAEWALKVKRDDYRKSILTWFRNVEEKHTTPYKPKEKKMDFTEEDVKENKRLAESWEESYRGKGAGVCSIQAGPSKVIFALSLNERIEVSYQYSHEEFKKLCQKSLQRLKIIT